MKKNDSINYLFLFLCLLLMGFVYLNNKMPQSSFHSNQKMVKENVSIQGQQFLR